MKTIKSANGNICNVAFRVPKSSSKRGQKVLGDVFKVWRLQHGYNIHQVSQESTINYHAIENLENGNDVNVSTFTRYLTWIIMQDGDFDFQNLYCIYGGAMTFDDKGKVYNRHELYKEYRKYIPEPYNIYTYRVEYMKSGMRCCQDFVIEDYSDKEDKVKQMFNKEHSEEILKIYCINSKSAEDIK